MRKHAATLVLIAGATAALTGCGDNLQVNNLNSPDVARAYSTPAGIEGVIAGLGVQVFNPQRASESVNTQAKLLAGESYATVANFGMAARASLPRTIISNEMGNDNSVGNLANFNSFSRLARTAANALAAVDALIKSGSTIGSPAQDARAKAFGFLILGETLGNLSLAYDSAAIVTPAVPSDEVPGLSGAAAVNAAALSMLDSAVAYAEKAKAASGANGFPLPNTWLNGISPSADDFIKIARSFKARFRAGVARTPAERAAVNWQAVIADATNGITSDLDINIGGGSGWSATFDENQAYVVGGWHQFPIMYAGFGDVSGSFEAWLATPWASRRAALIVTPDTRWPKGNTRAAQQADQPDKNVREGLYVVNRPSGQDVPGTGPGDSFYDHRRYGNVNTNSHTGPYTDMSATEISMLAAEGYIRTGNIAAAIDLVNQSRVRNGIEPIPTSLSSATTPYSTDKTTCVPQVPSGPSFTTTACGSLLEAMKYEKRMETAFTGYMIWFTDSRGWGDLWEGTVVEWPVPYQEMQARQQGFYNGDRRAGKGTYGY